MSVDACLVIATVWRCVGYAHYCSCALPALIGIIHKIHKRLIHQNQLYMYSKERIGSISLKPANSGEQADDSYCSMAPLHVNWVGARPSFLPLPLQDSTQLILKITNQLDLHPIAIVLSAHSSLLSKQSNTIQFLQS